MSISYLNNNDSGFQARGIINELVDAANTFRTGSYTGSFTGSLQGTASYTLSSSYALSSSYTLSSSYSTTSSYTLSSSYSTTSSYVNPLNQTVIITGSLNITGSTILSGSLTAIVNTASAYNTTITNANNNASAYSSFVLQAGNGITGSAFEIDVLPKGNTVNTYFAGGISIAAYPANFSGDSSRSIKYISSILGTPASSSFEWHYNNTFTVGASTLKMKLDAPSGILSNSGSIVTSGSLTITSGSSNTNRDGALYFGSSGSVESWRISSPNSSLVIQKWDGSNYTHELSIGGENNIISIGNQSSTNNIGQDLISIGRISGNQNSGSGCIFLGTSSGTENIGDNVVAIGPNETAKNNQGDNVISIGENASTYNLGNNLIAIGYQAGKSNEGNDVIALGYAVAQGNLISNSFIISNNNLPSYANYTEASTFINLENGAMNGNTYLYHDQSTNSIGAIRL